ncbi:hypothetical protein Pcinc_009240 [Petrolisthes cinctipes]|uniref:Uncharacterized protein n=1 Tax=Petrolisthes cinctipes TaxID=88211 RepID=A0AAE1G7R7_PETCI|nr:hypothetical protein Pcinc_009240 [Petrolisthes cinctipes]
MDLHEVFDFKENGFDNVIEKVTEDSVTIRTNIRTRDDFKKWNEVYMAKTHSRFNSKRLRSVGERKLFREVLICHHGVKHKGVKKTYTGCKAYNTAQLVVFMTEIFDQWAVIGCNILPYRYSERLGKKGGIRTGRGAVNTLPAATPNSSRQLLLVLDSTSGARFLVHTGATVSAVPPSAADKATEYPSYDLLAANGTSIATYGTRTLNLDLGLPEKVIWSFIVADVRHPILGLDFLHSQDLLVDSRYQQLHHRPTTCTIKATPCAEVTPRITHVSPEPAYTSLLQEFPELTSTTPHSGRKRHNVMHRIITQGQPCFARPRRLPPERLQAAKKEFEQLLQEADPLPSISLNYTDIARVQSTDNELQSLLEEGTALRLQRHAIPGTQQPICTSRYQRTKPTPSSYSTSSPYPQPTYPYLLTSPTQPTISSTTHTNPTLTIIRTPPRSTTTYTTTTSLLTSPRATTTYTTTSNTNTISPPPPQPRPRSPTPHQSSITQISSRRLRIEIRTYS